MGVVPLAGAVPAAMDDRADRLSALFDAHYGRLYRLARRVAASRDDALDLVQETFLRAARSTRSIPNGARDEEAWLVRVLVNIQRDRWRRSTVRRRYEHEHGAFVPPPAAPDAEAAAVARASVWSALDSLTPRRRTVIVLHELDGLDVAAIAALLNIARVTVRWHLSRGRIELARLLGVERTSP